MMQFEAITDVQLSLSGSMLQLITSRSMICLPDDTTIDRNTITDTTTYDLQSVLDFEDRVASLVGRCVQDLATKKYDEYTEQDHAILLGFATRIVKEVKGQVDKNAISKN